MSIACRFLSRQMTAAIVNNLYPFVHLNVNGNLFILPEQGLLCVASAEDDSAQSAKDAEAEVLVFGGAEDLKLGRCCLKSFLLSIWTLVILMLRILLICN